MIENVDEKVFLEVETRKLDKFLNNQPDPPQRKLF